MFLWNIVQAQTQLYVEGVNEIVRFQTDLSKQTGGFISFKSSPTDYRGYVGIHPRRPGDIEIGTPLGSTGKVNISMLEDPKLSIDQQGNVIIKNLQGFSNSIPRPVTASFSGDLSAHTGFNAITVPCNTFVANDRDGEFTQMVNPAGTVQFIQHISDAGELAAPITLPLGVSISRVEIYYVNQHPDVNADDYRIAIFKSPFIPLSGDVPERVSGWITLPTDGAFTGSSTNHMDMGVVTSNLAPISIEEDFVYSLIVKCEDCSNQFLRSVNVNYIYP